MAIVVNGPLLELFDFAVWLALGRLTYGIECGSPILEKDAIDGR